jgi:hypothetical protein
MVENDVAIDGDGKGYVEIRYEWPGTSCIDLDVTIANQPVYRWTRLLSIDYEIHFARWRNKCHNSKKV